MKEPMKTNNLFDIGLLVRDTYPKFVDICADPVSRHEGFEKLDERTAKRVLAYTGLVGEAGEVSEVFKKYFIHGKPYNRDALVKEMGDVMWYFFLMCQMENISLQEVLKTNMKKLAERHLDNDNLKDHWEFFADLIGLQWSSKYKSWVPKNVKAYLETS